MASILDGYTSTEQVVATLGATDDELSEDMLVTMGLDTNLRAELYSWLPDHATIFALQDNPVATAAELHQVDLLQLFSQYFCCSLVAQTLSVSVPMTIDNTLLGTKLIRQSTNWKEIAQTMADMSEKFRIKLEEALALSGGLLRTKVIVGVTPDTDPTDFGL